MKPAVMEVCGLAICTDAASYASITLEDYGAWLKKHVSLSQEEMQYCHEDVLRRLMSID